MFKYWVLKPLAVTLFVSLCCGCTGSGEEPGGNNGTQVSSEPSAISTSSESSISSQSSVASEPSSSSSSQPVVIDPCDNSNDLNCKPNEDADADGIVNAEDDCDDTLPSAPLVSRGCALEQLVIVESMGYNAGSNSYFSQEGTRFLADAHFSGGKISVKTTAVANTEDDALFQTIRFGNFNYAFPVTGGAYRVSLYLNEVFWTATDQRVFTVKLEGQDALANLDLFQEAGGKNKAIIRTFDIVNPGETLDLEFITVKDNAAVAAILIQRLASPVQDEDADGVINLIDQCAETNPGAPVNENGCSTQKGQILSVNLIDAKNDQIVTEINNNQTIDIANKSSTFLTAEAIVDGFVKSIRFDFNGDTGFLNTSPYALGNNGETQYQPYEKLTLGNHTLILTPFNQWNGGGLEGDALTLNFTLIDSSPRPEPLAKYHGVKPFHSFSNGVIDEHAWTLDNIAFYTWDDISQENADRWLTWYKQCNEQYEIVLGREAYLENDVNFGPKKVIAVVDANPMLCGTTNAAGCGNKRKAQGSRGRATAMKNNPESILPHWVLLYEMGRGGRIETFYNKGIWPKSGWNSGMPHTMAGVCFHTIGGDQALEAKGTTPGNLLAKLDDWENETLKFHENFENGSANGYIPHDLMAAMMNRILQETSSETLGDIFKAIAAKPERDNAKDAMCDFVDAVNSQTNNQFDQRLIGPWGMPNDC